MRSPDSSVTDVFEHWPEKKTVLTLAVPSIISQLVTTAYSLTDTFFIGRIGSEYDIAAVSVSYTAMIMLNTVAAVGIAHKFDQIPMHVSTGFSAGSLPVIGYTFAARRLGRMKRVMKYTLRYSLYTALGFAGIYLLAAPALTRLFISDPLTAQTSARFLRIICVGCPGMAVSFTLTALFQATGRPKEALFLSLYRKGAGDIPLLFLMNWLFPMTGLLMVQPIVDTSAMGIAFLFYRRLAGTLYADSAEEKACTANG